jgi:RNA polymerase sigma factor (sigma-70 family)
MSTRSERAERDAPAVVQLDVAALYDAYSDKLFSGALSVLSVNGLTSEAGDAVQAVVTNLARMYVEGTLTPRDDWAGYLWKSARNQALKIVRSWKTDSLDQRLEQGVADKLAERTDGLDPTAEHVESSDAAARLNAALEQLDPRRRRIVTGYYLDDMTDAQLGAELNISGQRVGALRRDSHQKLARLLDGGGHQ